jgi:histone-lysine N-methyltransferase SETMAR
VLPHPPYSPDLAPADFFLFRKVKEELAGLNLTQESLKSNWEGVVRNIAEDEFAVAFSRWFERCEKCIRIGGDYVKKS